MAIPFIGKILDTLIDKGGDIISELVTDKDLAKRLDHEFKSLLSTQNHDIQRLEIEAEKEQFQAQQVTVQAELHQNDLYTKRTRPKIATKSFYAGLVYACLTAIPEAGIVFGEFFTLMPWQFNWPVLMLLYSPALTYMGVRGFDKWKNPGQ